MMFEVIRYASTQHRGQYRKYTHDPYISHPMSVAGIVSSVILDEEVLAAAILHDVVEDTDATIQGIRMRFGLRVADLVYWLTDISTKADGNRASRKALDRSHYASAPADAQTIKVADLIDNSKTILKFDPDFAKVYIVEKQKALEVLTKADPRLIAIANKLIMDYYLEKNQ